MSSPSRRRARRAAPLPKLWEVRPPSAYELQRADDLVRGYAIKPIKQGIFHYGATADGRRVKTRSNRSLGAVLATLDAGAGGSIATLRIEGSAAILSVTDTPRTRPWPPTSAEKHLAALSPATGTTLTAASQDAEGLTRLEDGRAMWDGELVDLGPLVSQRARAFLSLLHQRQTARSTMIDSAFTMRIFIELVGDKHVGEINHDDCDSFVRALSIWPANATKRLMFRELAAPEVLRAAMKYRTPPLHLRTQQKHVDRMRCFFKYLENRREIEPNLLKGVRLYSRGKMMSKSRYPFPEELLTPMFQKLHASKLRQPFMYWAPILALYQGMRINEIGQLYVDDVFCEHDIWYLRLTDNNPEQRLKNVHSRRVLPLRQEVLDCGFLDLVEQARSWGRATLFPGVIWGANGPGDTISRWFNYTFLRKTCAIKDRHFTFHSLRHTFANLAKDSDVLKSHIAALLGHTCGTDVLMLHYFNDDQRPSALLAPIKAIRFPALQHTPYDPDQFEHAFRRSKSETRRNQAADHRMFRIAQQ